MGTSNYSDGFKRHEVHLITVRGYPTPRALRWLLPTFG